MQRANAWLHRLDLAHLVYLEAGHFSTVDLSPASAKRLALLHAILEDREILISTNGRRIRILDIASFLHHHPAGTAGFRRTVIVVSHDDRYFDVADRVVHMANGASPPSCRSSVPPPHRGTLLYPLQPGDERSLRSEERHVFATFFERGKANRGEIGNVMYR